MISSKYTARRTLKTRSLSLTPYRAITAWGAAAVALLLMLSPGVRAAEQQDATDAEMLQQAGTLEELDKAGNKCNAGGYHCTGRWADLIGHLFTNNNGVVFLYLNDDFKAEIETKGYCTLHQGAFIKILPFGGAEQALHNQLYISFAMDLAFSLRLWPEADTGECTISYIRALYAQ